MTTDSINKMKLYLADILFPNRCPFCGKFIKWDKLLCESCADKRVCANDVICRRCGQEKCLCGAENKNFDRVYAAYFYDGEGVTDAVYRFKHEGSSNFAELAAEDCVAHMLSENAPKPDIIVPVPMGKRKRSVRGYNQAEIFAKSIAKRLDIPIRNDILFKYDEKDEQHYHNAAERRERVKTLFYGCAVSGAGDAGSSKDAKFEGIRALLCDDVITTGSTVDRCAELLKERGVKEVTVFACAATRLT